MSVEHAEICRRAADIVQEQGMCKGSLFDDEGHVCMWGALNQACEELQGNLGTLYDPQGFISRQGPVHMAIRDLLHEDGLDVWPGSWTFNDLPDTDEKDVAKFLMSVADAVELA